MRHSLSQLLAASSGPTQGRPREPAAAFCLPREGSGGGSAETGDEAEPVLNGGGGGDPEAEELLFPAGLELDEWLEAAVAVGPDWARDDGGDDHPRSPEEEEEEVVAASGPPPSSSSCSGPGRGGRLKAAEAARLNRQRKKQYVQGLESRLQGLAAENRQLRDRNRGLCRRLRDLERETGYLRAVLANQSALGRLLSRLAGHGGGRVGLRVSSSLWEEGEDDNHEGEEEEEDPRWGDTRLLPSCGESSSSSDHDYALPVPREEEGERGGREEDGRRLLLHGSASPSPAGLCLHVDRGQVSVEFCSVCARRAAAGSAPSPSLAAKIFFFRCLPCQAPLCRG